MTKRVCTGCDNEITERQDGQLRVHYLESGLPCPGGAKPDPKNIDDKARRYLADGKVNVIHAAPGDCEVAVQGSKPEPYRVRLVGATWSCPCEARSWRCAHVVAAGLVIPSDFLVEGFGSPTMDTDLDELLAATTPAPTDEWSEFDG